VQGTVSGAPKVRAMELIAELEKEKRGVYAGAVGYFGYGSVDGDKMIEGAMDVSDMGYVLFTNDVLIDRARHALRSARWSSRMASPISKPG
jgi:hypothetical protein